MTRLARNPDRIDEVDDVSVDPDEGGVYLRLSGDLVGTCEAYLADENAEGMLLRLALSPTQLQQLATEIDRLLP